MVHRDVKPGNLLRSHEGVVKLADFGIAKAAEDSEITKAGSVLGTAAYLSPEQARGEKAGPPADLYALGVVSYQLLTGRLPYEAASLTDLARMQESGPAARAPATSTRTSRARSARPSCARCTRCPRAATRARWRWATRSATACAASRRTPPTPPWRSTPPRRRGCSATPAPHASRPAPRAAPRSAPAARWSRSTSRRAAASRPAAPRRRRPVAPRARPRASAATRCAGVVVLVLLLAIAVGGVLAYQTVQDNTDRAVQLREDVRGDVQDAVDEIKGLIEDNTQ